LDIVWGVTGIIRKNVGDPFSSDLGDAIYDEDFDLSAASTQLRLVDACRVLREKVCAA
jgi:hypothetical protein